jgi:hypothetical protein|tara:strand:+ start:3189 stop:3386 length:198 start_codon:yes stop_codon:yes gene_type:complete
MTNKTVEQTFDGYTFNNLSEVFEYIQGRLDVLYESNESDVEKDFQSMVLMKRFNEAVYSHYKESE